MNKDLKFAELPDTIRAVMGSSKKFYRAVQVDPNKIIVWNTYDRKGDVWNLIGGKWTFWNPGTPKVK